MSWEPCQNADKCKHKDKPCRDSNRENGECTGWFYSEKPDREEPDREDENEKDNDILQR